MKSLSICSLITGLLLVTINNASASVIYQYTGTNYSTAPGPYNTSMSLSITLELNSLLAPNSSLAAVSPLSFSTFDGVYTLTDATDTSGALGSEQFNISTDSSGNIINWSIKVTEGSSVIGEQVSGIESFRSVSGASERGTLFECTAISSGDCTGLTVVANAFISSAPGTWTVTAVPLPAAVWLFGSGFIGLIGFARRKKV